MSRIHFQSFRCTNNRGESLLLSSKPLKDKFHAEKVDTDLNGNDSNKNNKSLDETEDKVFVKNEVQQDNLSEASELSNDVNNEDIAVEKSEEDVFITFPPTYSCLTCSATFMMKADLWLHCKEKYHECDIGKFGFFISRVTFVPIYCFR